MDLWVWILVIFGVSLLVGEILARFFKKGGGDAKLREKTGSDIEGWYKIAEVEAEKMAEKTLNKFQRK